MTGSPFGIKQLSIGFAIVTLLFQFGLQFHLAKTDSQTTDEAIHLYAGYRELTRHDFNFSAEHPPLIRLLAALPLLILHPHDSSLAESPHVSNFFYHGRDEQRAISEAFLYQSGNNADQLLEWGRVPIIGLTVLLGLTIYCLAVKFWGWSGGMVALGLYVLDPTIAAHGHLITTDMGVAFFYLLATVSCWQFLKHPTWTRCVLFGVLVALALLAKFTSLILIPGIVVLFAYYLYSHPHDRTAWWPRVARTIVAVAVAWITIFSVYGANATLPPASDSLITDIESANVLPAPVNIDSASVTPAYNSVRHAAVPRDFFKGLIVVIAHSAYGHESFLLGKIATNGWWYYFPVLIVTKTPLITLLLFLGSAIVALKHKASRQTALFLLLSSGVFLAGALTSRANIGIRHILPLYPFLFILSGAIVMLFKKPTWVVHAGVGLLAILAAADFALASPSYLSYFNTAAGGSNNGYTIATDSNTDWGQDLKRIRDYIQVNNIDTPYLEYYWDGLSSVPYYGITSRYLTSWQPGNTGTIIIGASALQSGKFEWVKNLPLVDRITPSVFVYQVD